MNETTKGLKETNQFSLMEESALIGYSAMIVRAHYKYPWFTGHKAMGKQGSIKSVRPLGYDINPKLIKA